MDLPLRDFAVRAGLREPSIVIRLLNGAPAASDALLEPDRPLYPASMIKTPLAAALFGCFAEGTLSPSDRWTVACSNMTSNDKASPLLPGYRATLELLVELMLTRSDNVATNVLLDVIGRSQATAFAHRIGLAKTFLRRKVSGSLPLIHDPEASGRNAHCASEAALLFAAIARRMIPGSDRLEAILSAQEWNGKLSRGLRTGDRFAHKTGDTDAVAHDGGILRSVEGRTYVLVVYTGLESSPRTDDRFADFMRLLRPLL